MNNTGNNVVSDNNNNQMNSHSYSHSSPEDEKSKSDSILEVQQAFLSNPENEWFRHLASISGSVSKDFSLNSSSSQSQHSTTNTTKKTSKLSHGAKGASISSKGIPRQKYPPSQLCKSNHKNNTKLTTTTKSKIPNTYTPSVSISANSSSGKEGPFYSGQARLIDLCNNEKVKIAKLVKVMLKYAKDNQDLQNLLSVGGSEVEERLKTLDDRYYFMKQEKEALSRESEQERKKLERCLELLKAYQTKLVNLTDENESRKNEWLIEKNQLEQEILRLSSIVVRFEDKAAELKEMMRRHWIMENHLKDMRKEMEEQANEFENTVRQLKAEKELLAQSLREEGEERRRLAKEVRKLKDRNFHEYDNFIYSHRIPSSSLSSSTKSGFGHHDSKQINNGNKYNDDNNNTNSHDSRHIGSVKNSKSKKKGKDKETIKGKRIGQKQRQQENEEKSFMNSYEKSLIEGSTLFSESSLNNTAATKNGNNKNSKKTDYLLTKVKRLEEEMNVLREEQERQHQELPLSFQNENDKNLELFQGSKSQFSADMDNFLLSPLGPSGTSTATTITTPTTNFYAGVGSIGRNHQNTIRKAQSINENQLSHDKETIIDKDDNDVYNLVVDDLRGQDISFLIKENKNQHQHQEDFEKSTPEILTLTANTHPLDNKINLSGDKEGIVQGKEGKERYIIEKGVGIDQDHDSNDTRQAVNLNKSGLHHYIDDVLRSSLVDILSDLNFTQGLDSPYKSEKQSSVNNKSLTSSYLLSPTKGSSMISTGGYTSSKTTTKKTPLKGIQEAKGQGVGILRRCGVDGDQSTFSSRSMRIDLPYGTHPSISVLSSKEEESNGN